MSAYRPTPYRIVKDDLTGPEVAALLELHLAEMHALSPACKVHAMPVERLRQPDVTFYAARLSPSQAEKNVTSGWRSRSSGIAWTLHAGDHWCISPRCSSSSAATSGPVRPSSTIR